MNAAQLSGIRQMAAAMHQVDETYTAREMALMPHSLDRKDANIARTPSGQVFGWVSGIERWVRVR